MTIVEHLSKFNELITKSAGGQDVLTNWFKELVMIMRQELKNKIIPCLGFASRCPPDITGLFLMAEGAVNFNGEIPREIKECLKTDYMAHVRDIRWAADSDRQVETNLWALFVGQKVIDGFSLNDHENELSACFHALVSRKSYVLSLLAWLFPEFVTQERMNIVEGIAADESLATWCLRDRMLFGLANCNKDAAWVSETQIREPQGSDTLAVLKGNGASGDIRSDSIGLLTLISCANPNSGNSADDAVWQTVQRVIAHLIGAHLDDDKSRRYYDSDIGWIYYALCEYVNFCRKA